VIGSFQVYLLLGDMCIFTLVNDLSAEKFVIRNVTLSSKLRTHMHIHSGERLLRCKVFDKKFPKSSGLKMHIHMRIHTREQPFGCEVCDKKFNQLPLLRRHMHIHTREPFYC